MAKKYVQNMKEVKDLADAVAKSAEGGMNSAFEKTLKLTAAISQNLSTYDKNLRQNKKTSGQMANISKSIVKDAQKSTMSSKLQLALAKMQLRFGTGLSKAQKKQLGAAMKQHGVDKARNATMKRQAALQKAAAGAFKMAAGAASLIGTALKFMWGLLTRSSRQVDMIGKSFGTMARDMTFTMDLLDSQEAAIKFGKSLEDVLATTSTLNSEFGIAIGETGELTDLATELGVAVGVSQDEATRFVGTMKVMSGLSTDQTRELAKGVKQLSIQNKVAPAAVFKDMAESADEVASFTKDGGKNIAAAAIQARKMGLSLKTTAGIAKSLLSFESSIQNEMEASFLIGKRLNFQKARQFALTGDLTKMMDVVLKQLGGEAEFNKLNSIQRESVASALGRTVPEIQKLIKGEKELNLVTALTAGNFSKLAGTDALSGLTQMINQIKAFAAELLNALTPAMEQVTQYLAGWLSEDTGIQAFITKADEWIQGKSGEFASGFTESLDQIRSLASGMGDEEDGFMAQVVKVVASIGDMGKMFKTIKPWIIGAAGAMTTYALASAAASVYNSSLVPALAGPIAYGLALAAGAVAIGTTWGVIKSSMEFDKLPSGTGASLENSNSAGATFHRGETVVRTVDLDRLIGTPMREMNDRIDRLTENMENYFGMGGMVYRNGITIRES